jgi:hypothetical protein
MRKLIDRKIVEQGGICPICREEFLHYNDIVPDHGDRKEWQELGEMILPTTFHFQATHFGCKEEKGSTRTAD